MATFKFRQFEISHESSAMKVGTDGVLLGAWTDLSGLPRLVADIGSGSGLIALMIAQRDPQASVVGLELDQEALREAEGNVTASPWAARVTMEHGDFAVWDPRQRFDLMVSNPPFFTETLRSPDGRRSLARHGGSLSPLTLVDRAPDLLTPGGRLSMITPADAAADVEWHAALRRMSVRRRTMVCSRAGKAPVRILWDLSVAPCATESSTLCLRDRDGNYTEEYLSLVNDFYLWLK